MAGLGSVHAEQVVHVDVIYDPGDNELDGGRCDPDVPQQRAHYRHAGGIDRRQPVFVLHGEAHVAQTGVHLARHVQLRLAPAR